MEVKAYLVPLEEEEEFMKKLEEDPEFRRTWEILGSPLEDYILLHTPTFDHLPLKAQESLKKGMEVYLRSFGLLFLAEQSTFTSLLKRKKQKRLKQLMKD